MSALGYQVPPSSFFLSLCIRIFIFLLYLHIDYLSPTLGGLRLHSQDLSHPEHISKHLPCNLSCATTIYGHFLIKEARGMGVLHLI